MITNAQQNDGIVHMKCPRCGARINAFYLLSRRSMAIDCVSCSSNLEVKGMSLFLIVPMVVFFVFPVFLFPSEWYLLIPITLASIIGVYYLSFFLFVRLEKVEKIKDAGIRKDRRP